MNPMKKIAVTFSTVLLAQSALAANMLAPQVELNVQSRDGLPVQGVSLTAILGYEALSVQDCSGFICIPSFPKYRSSADAAVILGETDKNGTLVVEPKNFNASAVTARNLKLTVFTSGLIAGLCDNGSGSANKEVLNVLPQFLNNQPVVRNPECQTVEIQKGEVQTVRIECESPFTNAEIEQMKETIQANCQK